MATLKPFCRRVGNDRGAELIEFALVLPLLLLIVAGIVDFGFLFQSYEVVTNAAREGARIGILPGYSSDDVSGRVRSYITTAGLTGTPVIAITSPSIETSPGGPTVRVIRVQVDYPHQYLVLGPIAALVGGSFTTANLRSVATMRIEGPAAGS